MGDLSDARRQRMAKEQRGRCFFCHLRMLGGDMTFEHLVARRHGGTNKVSNLRIAHAACNSLVGTLPFYTKLALSDIGRDFGSDAFFKLASVLRQRANAHDVMLGRVRRPKRPPAHHHAATVLSLVAFLPEELVVPRLALAA